ncbi:BLUF domain-containing protein [uncultured Dokdonia sp.]|uniref:BLUF domain-containing protein n=1 Tax=uncultured Dokdonia sp. TaxID=575653 RepID=UPI00262FA2F5|nr:BLUF domain-containing protein [uncultured Dokdonia sp.]
MLYSICYVSTLSKQLEDTELKKLFDFCSTKNIDRGISGVLLHNSGNFLQYFEGDELQIKELYYSKIKKDTRHKNIITLFEKKIEVQYFTGYKAGFTSIISENQTRSLRSYLNLLNYLDSSEIEALSKTVNSFLSAV